MLSLILLSVSPLLKPQRCQLMCSYIRFRVRKCKAEPIVVGEKTPNKQKTTIFSNEFSISGNILVLFSIIWSLNITKAFTVQYAILAHKDYYFKSILHTLAQEGHFLSLEYCNFPITKKVLLWHLFHSNASKLFVTDLWRALQVESLFSCLSMIFKPELRNRDFFWVCLVMSITTNRFLSLQSLIADWSTEAKLIYDKQTCIYSVQWRNTNKM